MLDTLADWWGLQRHCGGTGGLGSVSRLSSPIPGPRGSRGHTCRTLPRARSVGASRRCARSRVNSDRAVDCPCSRLIRPQGPRPRTAAWRACPRRPHAVGCCWCLSPFWTARGTDGRLQRLEDSCEDHPAGKYVPNARSHKRTATPVPLANNVDVHLAARFCTAAPFGEWQTHCPHKFSAYMAGPYGAVAENSVGTGRDTSCRNPTFLRPQEVHSQTCCRRQHPQLSSAAQYW